MTATAFEHLLLTEEDLDDSFFGEEPSAAYDPVFLSGDEQGRTLIDIINALSRGSHPATKNHAAALFTSGAGLVVFHNVTEFEDGTGAQVYEQFRTALRDCWEYRMELNDGAQFDVRKLELEEEDDVTFARWLTTADPYRIEGCWAISLKGDVLSFVNVRNPDRLEIRRLAKTALNRIASAANP
ncbi:hypothetical protein ACN261_32190 [Micromonospora sp. WMMD723]|uniref:hypothetical protein n=1 Tax=unclassified Micromonospora TaxID=2617518 RepID=UPI003B95F594